nr:uncharacterized protein LOC104096754 isoform X1 [Nicotiana tomentosiformis]
MHKDFRRKENIAECEIVGLVALVVEDEEGEGEGKEKKNKNKEEWCFQSIEYTRLVAGLDPQENNRRKDYKRGSYWHWSCWSFAWGSFCICFLLRGLICIGTIFLLLLFLIL